MGEQSTRALRGGKMEDVIFGGTAKRKQTGYAEVSLVLDNTSHIFDMEESEVMVTRRYYRSCLLYTSGTFPEYITVAGDIITVNTDTAAALGADYSMFADMGAQLVEVQTTQD